MPQNLAEMYELCVVESNVRYSDTTRGGIQKNQGRGGTQPREVLRPPHNHRYQTHNVNNRNERDVRRDPPRCFKCNDVGHFARSCPNKHLRENHSHEHGNHESRESFSKNGYGRGPPPVK